MPLPSSHVSRRVRGVVPIPPTVLACPVAQNAPEVVEGPDVTEADGGLRVGLVPAVEGEVEWACRGWPRERGDRADGGHRGGDDHCDDHHKRSLDGHVDSFRLGFAHSLRHGG